MPRKRKIDHWSPPSYNDFRWVAEYEYDTIRPCDSSSEGCTCDGYNRCAEIRNAHVTDVSISSCVETFMNGYSDSMLEYCIDRILRIRKIYNPDNWEVDVCGGYYGEEICGVSLDSLVFDKVIDDINVLIQSSTTEQVEYILEMEYGYVLDRIKGLRWEIIDVPVSELAVPNTHYLGKVSQDEEIYSDGSKIPIGIYTLESGKYVLVDGYHRYIEYVKKRNGSHAKIVAGRKR